MSENQTIKELLEKAKQRDIEAAKEILDVSQIRCTLSLDYL